MQIQMTIKGLMIDPVTSMPIVILRDDEGQHVLPIWVGLFEANAIALQLENVRTPRPMTHDLLRDVLGLLEAIVERVVVSELRDNTFFAILHVRASGKVQQLDARPSDALALALRTGSPIFVEDSVIERARTAESSRDSSDINRLQNWLENLTEDELGKYKM